MCTWKGSRYRKSAAWLFVNLVILMAFGLISGTAYAQDTTPTPGPYPTPVNPYPGPETATFEPTASPTLAATSAGGLPTPTPQLTPGLPTPTAFDQPQPQATQALQGTPQPSGPAPTYMPFPEITFQVPEQNIAGPNDLSQEQASPTPVDSRGNGGIGRWVPLGVILVIWGLLAGWFYLSFRRMG
jgi:hypothetical protein